MFLLHMKIRRYFNKICDNNISMILQYHVMVVLMTISHVLRQID
jgi:hypothetical protein